MNPNVPCHHLWSDVADPGDTRPVFCVRCGVVYDSLRRSRDANGKLSVPPGERRFVSVTPR